MDIMGVFSPLRPNILIINYIKWIINCNVYVNLYTDNIVVSFCLNTVQYVFFFK